MGMHSIFKYYHSIIVEPKTEKITESASGHGFTQSWPGPFAMPGTTESYDKQTIMQTACNSIAFRVLIRYTLVRFVFDLFAQKDILQLPVMRCLQNMLLRKALELLNSFWP